MPRRVPRREHRDVAFVPLADSVLATGLDELIVCDESVLPGVRLPSCRNDRLLVQFTATGTRRMVFPGREIQCLPGGLLAVSPGCSWSSEVAGGLACHELSVILAGPWAVHLAADLAGQGGILLDRQPPTAVIAAHERLVRLGLQRPAGWDWGVLGAFGELAAHLAGLARSGAARPITERVGELVDRQPAEPWRLDRLAATLGMSLSVFTHAFRGETGEGPASWIRRRRMDHARRLLAMGSSPSEVARRLGFPSLAQFSRCFSTTIGMPPSAVGS